MPILFTVLLVFFVIIAILLILMVLVQTEEGDGLGGIFAGGSSSAFGSRSGNVLTKTTTVLGVLFLVVSLSLALLNRTSVGEGVLQAGREQESEEATPRWWDPENSEIETFEINPFALSEDALTPDEILSTEATE